MTFSKTLIAAPLALTILSACGGNGDTSSATENVVEKPVVTDNSSTAPAEPEIDTSLAFAALPAPYSEADYNRGRRTFKLCQACHQLGENGFNLVGPKLYGIFGRQVGTVEAFSYSKAVSEADFVWTPEKLDEWLVNPDSFLPGNNMAFTGVRKPEDRAAVIAYIMLETGYGTDETSAEPETVTTPE